MNKFLKDQLKAFVWAKPALRIALSITIFIHLFCAVYFMLRGSVDTMLYLAIYCFIFAQLPALFFLLLFALYRRVNRLPVWTFIKTESLLLLLSAFTAMLLWALIFFMEN